MTIDAENNVWVTDVAMHQVFQFPPYGGKEKQPNIVLGKPVGLFILMFVLKFDIKYLYKFSNTQNFYKRIFFFLHY